MDQKIEEIEIGRIFLYEENPRHERLGSQEEIIAYLCQDEQVLSLATSICQEGTNPLELVGLVEKPGSGQRGSEKAYEVWEGNRRICAIQLLNDPERAPASQRPQFEKLAKTYAPITRLNAVVFANREKLKFWMSNIHGGEQGGVGRKKWNADAKARATGSTRHALTLALMDRAEDFGFISAEQRKGRLTTFERYVKNPQVKEALGIDASDPQSIKTDLIDDDFKSVLKLVVEDLVAGKITSRDNSPQIRPYARKLPNRAGASTERGEPRPISEVGSEPTKPRAKTPPTKKPKKPDAPKKIHPSEELQQALGDLNNHKLSLLYYSICDVSAVDHPFLVAIGSWALIESLSALAGRKDATSFTAYYSNNWCEAHDIRGKSTRTTLQESLKRLALGGNTTKHDAVGATFDAAQLINDMAVVAPVLVATARSIKTTT